MSHDFRLVIPTYILNQIAAATTGRAAGLSLPAAAFWQFWDKKS